MGSLFKSPKAPRAMDPNAVISQANSQNTANAFQQAAFNRLSQTDPFGNAIRYTQSGVDAQGNPQFGVSQELGQYGQQALAGLSGLGQRYFDTAGQGIPTSDGAVRQAYDWATSFSAPRQQRETDALRTRLANMGHDPRNEAYAAEMRDLYANQSSANNTLAAQLQGQMFNQGLAGRQQQVSELRPGMEFMAGTTQPRQIATPGVNVGNVDVAGINSQAYQQQVASYQNELGQRNAMLGGLAGLGGTILSLPMGGGTSLGGLAARRMMGV